MRLTEVRSVNANESTRSGCGPEPDSDASLDAPNDLRILSLRRHDPATDPFIFRRSAVSPHASLARAVGFVLSDGLWLAAEPQEYQGERHEFDHPLSSSAIVHFTRLHAFPRYGCVLASNSIRTSARASSFRIQRSRSSVD